MTILISPPQRVPVGLGLVIQKDNQILLIKRFGKHGSGTWSCPGGWLDPKEEPEEGSCREALEEVGLQIAPRDLKFLGFTHKLHDLDIESVCLWFWVPVNKTKGEAHICEPEKIKEIGWFPWDALPDPLFAEFQSALIHGFLPVDKSGTF